MQQPDQIDAVRHSVAVIARLAQEIRELQPEPPPDRPPSTTRSRPTRTRRRPSRPAVPINRDEATIRGEASIGQFLRDELARTRVPGERMRPSDGGGFSAERIQISDELIADLELDTRLDPPEVPPVTLNNSFVTSNVRTWDSSPARAAAASIRGFTLQASAPIWEPMPNIDAQILPGRPEAMFPVPAGVELGPRFSDLYPRALANYRPNNSPLVQIDGTNWALENYRIGNGINLPVLSCHFRGSILGYLLPDDTIQIHMEIRTPTNLEALTQRLFPLGWSRQVDGTGRVDRNRFIAVSPEGQEVYLQPDLQLGSPNYLPSLRVGAILQSNRQEDVVLHRLVRRMERRYSSVTAFANLPVGSDCPECAADTFRPRHIRTHLERHDDVTQLLMEHTIVNDGRSPSSLRGQTGRQLTSTLAYYAIRNLQNGMSPSTMGKSAAIFIGARQLVMRSNRVM